MRAQETVVKQKCVRPGPALRPNLASRISFRPRLILFGLVLSVTVALIPSRPSAVRAVTCVTNPVVTNNGDSGAGSLRQAIMDACDGDTITFDLTNFTGPITLTAADPTDATSGLVIGKNLTITGPGANLLTVERSSASGTPQFRMFTINVGVTVTISGLTVTNGHPPDGLDAGAGAEGGGIFNLGTLT